MLSQLEDVAKWFLDQYIVYHVSNSDLPASQIANGGTSASALTINRHFISRNEFVYINGSKIIPTGKASNGTVHCYY
jgi:hypothetical protein